MTTSSAAASLARGAVLADVFLGAHAGDLMLVLAGALLTARVVWVDCDSSSSAGELRRFYPMPGMVSSGSGQNCHAYWFLREASSSLWSSGSTGDWR